MNTRLKNIKSILTGRERSKMIYVLFLNTFVSLLDIAFLAALIFIVHFYTQNDHTIHVPFFPTTLFTKYPLSLIIAFFLLFTLKNLFGYAVYKNQYRFVYSVASRLSENNLLHFLEGGYDAHVHINSSVYINKISRHPIEFGQHILANLQLIAEQCILITITLTAILIFSPALFLLLFVMLAPPIVLIGFWIKRRLTVVRRSAKPVHEKSVQHLQETLAGYIESNVYDKNKFFVHRYSKFQATFNDFLARQLIIQNLPTRLMEVFALLGLMLLIVINNYGTIPGAIGIITIGTFMAAAYKIIPGIIKILNSVSHIKTFSYTITSLMESKRISSKKDKTNIPPITTISFENIEFSYKTEKLIRRLSLEMKAGELIGLAGNSGRGKTTVVNLLLGFLEQQEGNILINNKSTSAAERLSYLKNISYVKQHPFLIHDKLLINITLDDQAPDEVALKSAVMNAGLDNLLSTHPAGLEMVITENGRNISGGQRQRIAIARAFYKDADVLIFDEPFNELDRDSELKLIRRLVNIADSGKIVILITHNKETLSYCHKLISLDEA